MAKAKPNTGTALTKWDERLAAMASSATEVQSSVGGVGNFISIRAGVLSYQGAQIPDNKMNVVILDAILEHQFYSQSYDPNNPSSPDCYAFGTVAKDMVPHENSPQLQHEDCPTCPQMQFGSAERGKGKACKAVQRLALITEGDLDNIEAATTAYLKLPFYSTLEYAAYVRQLANSFRKPPLAFVTELTLVPDPKSQFRVKFKMISPIEDSDAFEALEQAYERAHAEIMFPYPEIAAEAAPPARQQNGRGVSRTQKAAPVAAAPRKAAVQRSAAPVVAAPAKVGLRRAVKPAKF